MKRAMLAALLAAVAAGAAGCGGGSTPASVAVHQAVMSGGTHARAIRVERRWLADGDLVDIVLVQARFCGTQNGFTAPKINGRCVGQEVAFATQPGKKGGFADMLAHGDARLARAAWKSRPVFHIFPDIPGLLVRCRIPRAGGGTVVGLCETRLYRTHGVEFLEHWPLRAPPQGEPHTAGWIVTLDGGDRVVGVRRTGATPPQSRT